ncbi:MAG: hypothetical protein U9Q68_00065 [Euryarchaeota archaeon]|nr:MAG: Threonine synthase [ANME-2 cluster archaeon]MEA3280956.1 hypothetical protein [Euryarchaeota archaeon]
MNRMINTHDKMGFACGGADEWIAYITTGNVMKDLTEVVDVCAKPIEVDADIDAV